MNLARWQHFERGRGLRVQPYRHYPTTSVTIKNSHKTAAALALLFASPSSVDNNYICYFLGAPLRRLAEGHSGELPIPFGCSRVGGLPFPAPSREGRAFFLTRRAVAHMWCVAVEVLLQDTGLRVEALYVASLRYNRKMHGP